MSDSPILLFDGICNLCNDSVKFIIRRDKRGTIRFASLQSDVGQTLLDRHQLTSNLNSIVLIDRDRAYTHSTALLRVCRYMDGIWPFFTVLRIVPPPLRDLVYNFIARNRYRWFGKQTTCMIPTAEMRSRFLS